MFWVIETKEQIERFLLKGYEEAYVEIIPYNFNIHPIENSICGLFVKPRLSKRGYIINVSHEEALNINYNVCSKVLNSFKHIFTTNKKSFIHYFPLSNVYTIPHPPHNTYIQHFTNTHSYFYKKYGDKKDINLLIPLSKHYELYWNLFTSLDIKWELENEFIDKKSSLVFAHIEKNGIKVNKPLFEKYFHSIEKDIIYTQYNLNTTTQRPSNSFGGVNFAALNKKNGERACFIPQNDIFIEIDISAYHPHLLAKLINYKFSQEDVHEEFAQMYGVDYKKSKHLTFQQMYGGVFSQYKHLEFFNKMNTYTYKLWNQFLTMGEITCPISNHKFKKSDLEDMNPPKLLNYYIQNYESSLNTLMLWDIIKLMRGLDSKIVLYTYDSITLDLKKEEKYIVKDIIQIFTNQSLKVKAKAGKNYQELNLIEF